jgi:hypothetical protein
MKRIALFLALSAPVLLLAQETTLKAGESADLHAVYWIANCKSTLRDFGAVEILEGPPGVELAVRKEEVMAVRQGCPDKIAGGMVVLTAKSVEANWSGVVKYRVNYKTYDGDRQSNHQRKLQLIAK